MTTPQTSDHVPSEGVETEPGKLAFDAYWETPSARWDGMSDLGKAKWAQAERTIATALSSSAAAGSAGEDARGVANVMEALWRDAEDEAARLRSGFWPSELAIAEAFHEHRRETQPSLPPWSDVQPDSGIWKYSHDFAVRLTSLQPTPTEASRSETGRGEEARREIVAWLEKRIDAAEGDSNAHPNGHSLNSFYGGQAIAYENALSAVEDAFTKREIGR
jgi:hypothetical protein